jgi:hypothetical protein
VRAPCCAHPLTALVATGTFAAHRSAPGLVEATLRERASTRALAVCVTLGHVVPIELRDDPDEPGAAEAYVVATVAGVSTGLSSTRAAGAARSRSTT